MTRRAMMRRIVALVREAATLSHDSEDQAATVLEAYLKPYPDAAILFLLTQLVGLNKRLATPPRSD